MRIVVLGIGNVLMGDDGFGPAVIHAFETAYTVGADVDLVDLGTPGLDLTPWLADADAAIIVDTVKTDQPPGTLQLFGKYTLLQHGRQVRVGPHDPSLKDALLSLEFAGRAPNDIALIGIVPQHVGIALELTSAVGDRVADAVRLLAETLTSFGALIRPYPDPQPQCHRCFLSPAIH